MPARRKISDEQRERILAVAQLRQRVPTDRQLADECGCSVHAIRQTMTLMMGKLQVIADTESKETATMSQWPTNSQQEQ